jgi:predicted nucleotidyltransferase
MDPRGEVAREAARLLYTGAAEEYKQAKEQAARNLGVNAKPSNHEVALELDLLADQMEGEERKRLLVTMRDHALALMRLLSEYDPVLTGSVWRGTARRGSDVDINVYSSNPGEVESKLRSAGYSVVDSKEEVFTQRGRTMRSTHVFVVLNEAKGEVVVRPPEERGEAERCEIYGDVKKGLNLEELEKLMKTDPLRKFVPGRRYK